MEFKELAQTETSALLERLTTAAEAATQRVRDDYETQLTAMRDEAQGLRAQLEQETARAAALEGDLDSVIEAHKTVDVERQQVEDELRQVRESLAKARGEITQLEEVLEGEMARKSVLETTLADKSSVETDLASARAAIETLQADRQALEDRIRQTEARAAQAEASEASVRKQSGDTNNLLQTLTSAADAATKRIREEADAEIGSLRAQLDAARREAARGGVPASDGAAAPAPEMLVASVRALAELGKASSVTDLFAAVIDQLAPQFPRVALFRMKGKHLQGERGRGIDPTTDISKLVIPMSMDSLITRAANLGTIEDLAAAPASASSSPLGGSPAAALALPIRFQDETLAVVYADSETAWNSSHAAFATVIVQHTEILLTRLTQELKTLQELREYAGMLLQEAEQMHLADLEGKRPEQERVRRLQETIACGRQMYAKRASLEGPLTAGLLDAQIQSVLSGDKSTPFARELAMAVNQAESQHTAAS